MKLKHITAIFSFLAAFGLSVFLVGLTAPQINFDAFPTCREKAVRTTNVNLQLRIRQFLEADRQTGIEMGNDIAGLKRSIYRVDAEKIATFNLVEKMQKVKCDGLPENFCKAWDAHVATWKYKAFLLERSWKHGPRDYEFSHEQINNSYQKMLAAARAYGVDFQY